MGETTRPDPLAEWAAYRLESHLRRCGICTQTMGGPHDADCPVALGDALKAELVAARQREADYRAVLMKRLAFYSDDLFSDPPPGEHGATVDACSARSARHILQQLLCDLDLASSPEQETRE
jgi:hypothetical protein